MARSARNAVGAFVAAGAAGTVLLLAGCASAVSGIARTAEGAASPATSSSIPTSAPVASTTPTTATAATTAAATTATTRTPVTGDTDRSVAPDPFGSISASTTVGGSGPLDLQTTAWFTAMCEGAQPLTDLADDMESLSSADAVIDAFSEFGALMTTLSTDLADVPPPTFPGGEEYAANVVDGFDRMGTLFTDAADALAEGDTSVLLGLEDELAADGPLQQLSGTDVSPDLQDAVEALPACQALYAG
ncbi:hypothetical protein GIS00_12750 [Nakamurella sp. YIM 132087]|uniref:Lipoprotein n=1 Tax=Nakamurella alba TaxID=2665158 RepID=A0A7K1FL73_9ACTN|nr:hypothetical protein [Nakamurella alba]MTD14810.1 hypothetical protein [Nakamurella alba]